ncbi:hypothetical protein [Radiobacillus sp. PE A8.2]|uniref:hypothetical protein n=1 Tax=Radiobacillus sp. PE A8.2 TaxID=3380349 RepID=UPI00388E6B70
MDRVFVFKEELGKALLQQDIELNNYIENTLLTIKNMDDDEAQATMEALCSYFNKSANILLKHKAFLVAYCDLPDNEVVH